jgi:hypothetical protein
LPELPQQICEYQEDQLICSYTLQKVSYISVYDSISGEYHLTLRIEGTKDYDARGSNVNTYAMIGWKLYNAADEEVDSGVCYGLMAAAGKKFTSEDAVLKLKPGAYHLALLEIA